VEAESLDFHERVRYAFLDLAAADPKRYLVLDASLPPEEIATAVTERVDEMLTDPDVGIHPGPAERPDVPSQPKLSDAELVYIVDRELERRP
jgi:dTMP kinase